MENADIVWVGDKNQVAVVVAATCAEPMPEDAKNEIMAHCRNMSEGATVVFLDSAGARDTAEKLIVSAVHVELARGRQWMNVSGQAALSRSAR